MLLARIGALLQRRRFELDLDEELLFHLDMEIRKNVARGMDPLEAKLEAERAFGGVARVKEDLRAVRGLSFLDVLWQDLRSATRALRRARGPTFVVALTLALGIGVNTAMFSVVREVLLTPLPHLEARGLVLLNQSTVGTGGTVQSLFFSVPELEDLRSSSRTLESIVEYHSMSFILLGESEESPPERVDTGIVSAEFFDVLGVKPLHGRSFLPGEDEIDAQPVVLLGYEYWQRRYGGDPEVVGREITMNDRAHRIVGVLPSLPRFPEPNNVFMPVSSCPFRSAPGMRESRDSRMLSAVARLRPGVSVEAASEEVSAIAHRLELDEVSVRELEGELNGRAKPVLLLLFATTFFVLLIACSNASHLTLAGILDRRRELLLRAAIGGSRSRILRQLLTESVLLAIVGAVLGIACSWAMLGALVRLAERLTPRALEARLDLTVLGFALGLALAAGILVGALAAFLSHRGRRAGARTGSPALVVAQIAISLALLAAAGLTLESFRRLSRVDTGFTTERVVAALLDLDWHKYDRGDRIRRFHRKLLGKLSAHPAFSNAAIGRAAPLDRRDGPHTERFVTEYGVEALLDFHAASPEYFRTIGVPVLAGRAFDESDDDSARPVAIVNRRAAEELSLGENPVGRVIAAGGERMTIVGVVGDTRQYGLETGVTPSIYFPLDQAPFRVTNLVVRTRTDALSAAESIERAVHELDPDQAVARITTIEEARRESTEAPRLFAVLLSGFAALALAITSVGLAGSLALVVRRRRREIGLRVALGALPGDVSWMILRQGLSLLIAGLAVGFPISLALVRLLSGHLFEVEPHDPRIFAAVAVFLIAVAGGACFVPARRAMAIDPLSTTRMD